jgi:pimeloyl-ACP methyl ester carboxylesterase
MFEITRRRNLLGGGAAAILGAAAGWIGHRRFGARHHMPLPPPIQAERRESLGRAGRLAYYVAGEGTPLLLLHSINAAASAYEVRPLFERLQRNYRVYAVDLPGFGASDRGPRDYNVALFVYAIHDLLETIRVDHGSRPVDALALSLSTEFLARAAVEATDRFRSLALVNPTGFEHTRRNDQRHGRATREIPGVRKLLEVPLWSQAIFDLLVSRRSIRYFLRRSWGSDAIDEGLADYDYLTAHQPGARHAP